MCIKRKYSDLASEANRIAEEDEKAAEAKKRARRSHDDFVINLETLSIDEYVKPGAKEDDIIITNTRKMIVPSKMDGIDVVADLYAGYFRLQKRGTRTFVDKSFNEIREIGFKEYQKLTHFRIMKKGDENE